MAERQFDEASITDAVVARIGPGASPRVREVSGALVRHLHGFVREVEPTMDEWFAAIAFLTRTGQLCSDTRQEYILLSDVLGVSMLVDAINHRDAGATETTVLGPFYVADPPEHADGDDISAGAPGEPLLVQGSVRDEDGAPLAGAIVDTWQSDEDGYYDVQQGSEPALRARLRTLEDGRFSFVSVRPSSYPIPADGTVGDLLAAQDRHPFRPAHVHFRISAPGFRELITHVFVDGDEYLDSDVVFGVKESLVRPLERGLGDGDPPWRMSYDFVLAREAGAV